MRLLLLVPSTTYRAGPFTDAARALDVDVTIACEGQQTLTGLLPEELLVLPSHGEPFRGVQARLAALKRGHGQALARLERRLKTPMRAVDTFASLFARPVGDGLRGMATGEAVAHLNYLERQGRAARQRDAEGVDWWQATGRPVSNANDDNGE